jgi:galactitol-specific phosphotransferase system IIC component
LDFFNFWRFSLSLLPWNWRTKRLRKDTFISLRAVISVKKVSQMVSDGEAVAVDNTLKIKEIKPASKTSKTSPSEPVEEPERGLL